MTTISTRSRRLLRMRYGDTILLYRVDGVFRAFDSDASMLGTVLGLAGIKKGLVYDVAETDAESAIAKLVEAGHNVAVCERASARSEF